MFVARAVIDADLADAAAPNPRTGPPCASSGSARHASDNLLRSELHNSPPPDRSSRLPDNSTRHSHPAQAGSTTRSEGNSARRRACCGRGTDGSTCLRAAPLRASAATMRGQCEPSATKVISTPASRPRGRSAAARSTSATRSFCRTATKTRLSPSGS